MGWALPHGTACPTAGPSSRGQTDLGWGTWGIQKSHRSPHHRSWRAAGNRWPSPLWMVGVNPGPAHGTRTCAAMLPGSSGCSPTGHLCSPSTKMQSEKVSSSIFCFSFCFLHCTSPNCTFSSWSPSPDQFQPISNPAKALTCSLGYCFS